MEQKECSFSTTIWSEDDMDADPHSLTRAVELTGSSEAIAKAEQLIKDVLAEADSGGFGIVSRRMLGESGGAEQFVMKVPNNKVGLIICMLGDQASA